MGKVWVLRTETKGTGAEMVPLERVEKRGSREREPIVIAAKPRPRQPEPPKPKAPHRFKVVDVMTKQTIVEDTGTRQTVDALKPLRSIVDVNVYVWHEERERWRRLTFDERRALWELAHP